MKNPIRVSELFAGVGGFRLGLEGSEEFSIPAAGNYETVWANQWEPNGSEAKQFAWRCYEQRFGTGSCVNEDITAVLDKVEAGELTLPECDLLCGGFPCQDYSVARTASQASGIEGKKGVLWWQIVRYIDLAQKNTGRWIPMLMFENVDRLLKSPTSQRGRDFAIMLACLANRGYSVEWRVINAAEYGMPQQRRRTYIWAEQTDQKWDLQSRMARDGVLAEAFPVAAEIDRAAKVQLDSDVAAVSENFGKGRKVSVWQNAGVMQNGQVLTARVQPDYRGAAKTLGDVLVPEEDVPEEYYVPADELPQWQYLKGSKRLERISKTGHKYVYSEGSMAFPDSLDKPSRTILTAENGKSPSRFKHIIQLPDGRWRRLVPDELDQLQGFPKGWTNSGMSEHQRGFCMGNALCVGIPHRIGQVVWGRAERNSRNVALVESNI